MEDENLEEGEEDNEEVEGEEGAEEDSSVSNSLLEHEEI